MIDYNMDTKLRKKVDIMTCNFCGSTLEDNETECPYCGHKVGNSAKALAADMAAKFAPRSKEREKNPDAPSVAQRSKEAAGKAKSSVAGAMRSVSGAASSAGRNPSIILLIAVAVVALLMLITMFSTLSMKNQVTDMYQDMLSQFYQMQSANSQLSAKIDSLGTSVGSVSTSIQQQVDSRITITKQPSDCATYIGRTGNIPIFKVEAAGTNLKFTWQKLDTASGSWVSIVFDDQSNNTTYGVHTYSNIGRTEGVSELSAHDVTAAAYGSYRCLITDTVGEKVSDTVILTEREPD